MKKLLRNKSIVVVTFVVLAGANSALAAPPSAPSTAAATPSSSSSSMSASGPNGPSARIEPGANVAMDSKNEGVTKLQSSQKIFDKQMSPSPLIKKSFLGKIWAKAKLGWVSAQGKKFKAASPNLPQQSPTAEQSRIAAKMAKQALPPPPIPPRNKSVGNGNLDLPAPSINSANVPSAAAMPMSTASAPSESYGEKLYPVLNPTSESTAMILHPTANKKAEVAPESTALVLHSGQTYAQIKDSIKARPDADLEVDANMLMNKLRGQIDSVHGLSTGLKSMHTAGFDLHAQYAKDVETLSQQFKLHPEFLGPGDSEKFVRESNQELAEFSEKSHAVKGKVTKMNVLNDDRRDLYGELVKATQKKPLGMTKAKLNEIVNKMEKIDGKINQQAMDALSAAHTLSQDPNFKYEIPVEAQADQTSKSLYEAGSSDSNDSSSTSGSASGVSSSTGASTKKQ